MPDTTCHRPRSSAWSPVSSPRSRAGSASVQTDPLPAVRDFLLERNHSAAMAKSRAAHSMASRAQSLLQVHSVSPGGGVRIVGALSTKLSRLTGYSRHSGHAVSPRLESPLKTIHLSYGKH